MKQDKDQVWNDVLASLKVMVSEPTYKTWLSQTHLISLYKTDKTRYLAEIGCNSGFVKTHIETRYYGLTQETLMKIIDAPCDLKLVVKQQVIEKKAESEAPLFEERDLTEEILNKLSSSHINLNFTFEKFAVSGSNQMAHAGSEAVSREPGKAYNPLFIWGGVGVGKTHLMHAIGHRIIHKDINKKILACTGEDFTNDIIEGIRNKTTQNFRNKYRKLDALFVDDIQFIAGKDSVQEEFFHTFNAVVAAGGQIVLTSDRPPAEIPKLEDRLRSRFEAGLIVDVSQPDFELRCAIIQIKAKEKGIEITDSEVQLIAGNNDSARKIEGFLMKLSSKARMEGKPTDEEMISKLISHGAGNEEVAKVLKASPDQIIEAVCTHFAIGKRALLGKGRTKSIVGPRQILMYLLRTDLKLSLEEVGRLIGRDHTTVMHAVEKIALLTSQNVDTREDIMGIKNKL